MRRSIILSTVLAASAAVLGACQPPANNAPNVKPSATATPAASPSASPSGSPVVSPSPVKPGSSPEVKKADDKTGKDVKEIKPAATESPKAK